MKDLAEWVAILVIFFLGLFIGSYYNIELDEIDRQMIAVTGNDYYGFESLKRDCEKDLPRNEECVLIYEFIPVKTKGE